jgi:RNA polymerase sigma factor (sigma-70 family)
MSGQIRRIHSRALRDDNPLSDEALARACAGGDPAAIGALFDRFHVPVARFLYRLVLNADDVEDLVQTTFLELVRGKAVYDGRASVLTWLFAIATNVSRHHRRSFGRRRRLLAAVGWAQVPEESDAADRADARLQLLKVRDALRELSQSLREAFVLCELEGLSAREAAQVCGASEAAIWKRVSKARRAVRTAAFGEVSR